MTNQNNESKNSILASIRRNLATSAPFDVVHNEHRTPYQTIDSLVEETSFTENMPLVTVKFSQKNLIENFRENLVGVGGNFAIVKDKTEAATQIRSIIENLNAKKIAVSDSSSIAEIKSLLEIKAQILENASAQDLFECDLGITGAQFGISETGTLVLESEREFNRLTSLVPPIHVCLLEARNIRRTLGETLEVLEKDLSRTVTFITGPSRTSDIELTLAIGVHGPAELYVIVIEKE